MKYLLLFLILLIIFSESCQNPPPHSTQSPPIQDTITTRLQTSKDSFSTISLQDSNNTATTLLLFKKEKKLELWSGQNKIDVFDCASSNFEQLPIGTFDVSLKDNNYLDIIFPNEFYRQKKQSLTSFKINDARLRLNEVCYKNRINSLINLSKIWIFPNDARDTSSFTPCFACPHWTAELHSHLHLLLLEHFPSQVSN
jgi:hypothetical protein